MRHSTERTPSRSFLLFATALLFNALPASAGPNTTQQLPFHAVFQGTANPNPTGPCTLATQGWRYTWDLVRQ